MTPARPHPRPIPAFIERALFTVSVPARPRSRAAVEEDWGDSDGVGRLTVELQERENWCWAAVSLGLHRRFVELGGTQLRYTNQCDVARAVRPFACVDQCAGDACNKQTNLHAAIGTVDLLIARGVGFKPVFPSSNPVSIFANTIRPTIDAGNVVVAHLDRGGDRGHFVVVCGCDPMGGELVFLADPQAPDPNPPPVSFAEFLNSGAGTPGGGRVDELYPTIFS